jgi:hypothetical protein
VADRLLADPAFVARMSASAGAPADPLDLAEV